MLIAARRSCAHALATAFAVAAGQFAAGVPAEAGTIAPVGSVAADAALAPTPTGPDAETSSEIVVTAQKRAENVQNIPATVTAIGGDRIQRLALSSAVDIGKFAPNANAWNNDGRSRPRYYIRGIGNGNVSNNAVGAVSLYNDDVYLNNLALQGFPLFDLERVEVLSGPQGTLQGKNATAGSINFISRRPSFDADGYAKASLGDYGQKQFEVAAGGPLTGDRVAVRAAARIERFGGTATNGVTGSRDGDYTDFGARLQALATLGDEAGEVLANVHYRKLDSQRGATYVSVQPAGAQLPPVDRDHTASNLDYPQKVEASGALLRVNLNLPSEITLTSISGYDKGDRLEIADADASPREFSRVYSRTKPEQFSQEVRLASDASRPLNWIIGGYYFHETLRSFAAQATLNASAGAVPSYFYTAYRQKTDSVAAFANLRAEPVHSFFVQGGLRWTHDRSQIDLVSQRAVPPVAFRDTDTWWLPAAAGQTLTDIARQDDGKSWSRLNWDVSARWQFMPRAQVYGRVANGYRAGNFQGQVAPTTPPGRVDPETLTSYETGVKTSWLNGALTFNADAFYAKYKDIQVSFVAPAPGGGIAASLANVAAGYSKGMETELRAQPLKGLNVIGNVGLLRTKFTSFTASAATVNLTGREFARAPHVTGFVAADYELPISFGSFVLGADWRYNGRYYYLVTDETSPALQQSGYGVANARVSYRTPSNGLELTLAVSNVTDKRYKVQVLPYSFGSYGYILGNPRTVLGSAKLSF